MTVNLRYNKLFIKIKNKLTAVIPKFAGMNSVLSIFVKSSMLANKNNVLMPSFYIVYLQLLFFN